MAVPRGRSALRPRGVVRAVGRLISLVVIGFTVGLVFGLVTEEPELLARHLGGESEAVALREVDASADSETGAVEAAPAEYTSAATSTRPLVEPAERASTRSLPTVAAAQGPIPTAQSPGVEAVREAPVAARVEAPASARESAARPAADESAARRAINTRPWAIQVGAFSERRAARRLAEALRDEYPVEVLPARREGGRWRVRVQPIESEARARSLAETLKREEILPTWVTPMEGRAG